MTTTTVLARLKLNRRPSHRVKLVALRHGVCYTTLRESRSEILRFIYFFFFSFFPLSPLVISILPPSNSGVSVHSSSREISISLTQKPNRVYSRRRWLRRTRHEGDEAAATLRTSDNPVSVSNYLVATLPTLSRVSRPRVCVCVCASAPACCI